MSRNLFKASAVATALGGALLLSGAAGAASQHFGMLHTELGNAVLSPNPDDTLTISNIGSSGEDGVSIDLGEADGFACAFDMGPVGSLATGGKTTIYVPAEGCIWCEECIEVCEANAGSAAIGYMSSGFTPICLEVELLLDGTVVDSREFHPPFPAQLVTGDLGSSGGVPLRVEMIFDTYEARVRNPTDEALTIAGSVSVLANEVLVRRVVSNDGLPPGEPVRILAANVPSVTISSEALLARVGDMDGDGISEFLFGASVGNSNVYGACGVNLCALCPDCCDPPGGDPLDPPCGITVSNIGSSGEDGVRFYCRPWGSPWFVTEEEFGLSGVDLDAPDEALRFEATGIYSGVPGTDLGYCEIRNNPGAGALEVVADYSSIGSSEITVEVYDHGVLSGSVLFPGGSGTVLGNIVAAAPGGLNWNKCGKLGPNPPCFVACTDEIFTFFGGGQVLSGNDLRVLATGATGTIEDLSAFTIRATQTEDFTASLRRGWKVTLLKKGMVHTPLGLAQMDENPDGSLTVSNIGSSGLDGVSIDLGESEGAAIDFRGNFVVDSFFDITIDIYDDQCPTCPGGLVSRAHIDNTTAGSPTLDFSWTQLEGPATMTLKDDQGQIIASFPYTSGDPAIVTPEGAGPLALRSARLSVRRSTGGGGAPESIYVRDLILEDGISLDLGGGTIHYGVKEVVVIHKSFSTNVGSIDRACVVGSALGASPGSFTIHDEALAVFGRLNSAVGEARLAGIDCDDGTSQSHRLTISNLGSSGCDGFSIDLGDSVDDDADGDNIPDLNRAGGVSFVLDATDSQDDSTISTFAWNQIGPPCEGCTPELYSSASFERVGGTEREVTIVDLASSTMDAQIFDSLGNLVDEALGLPVGLAATIDTTELPGSYEHNSTGEYIYVFELKPHWTTTLPGRNPQTGAELRVRQGVPGGGGAGGAIWIQSSEVLVTSTSTSAVVVSEEGVDALPPPCPGDTTGDQQVNTDDFLAVLANWGPCPAPCPPACAGDTNEDCLVNTDDFLAVLSNWGSCLSP